MVSEGTKLPLQNKSGFKSFPKDKVGSDPKNAGPKTGIRKASRKTGK